MFSVNYLVFDSLVDIFFGMVFSYVNISNVVNKVLRCVWERELCYYKVLKGSNIIGKRLLNVI